MKGIDYQAAYLIEKQARMDAERILRDKSQEVTESLSTIQQQYDALMNQKRGLELLLNIAQVGELRLPFKDTLGIFLDAIGQLFEAEYGIYFFLDEEKNMTDNLKCYQASALCYLPKDYYTDEFLVLLAGDRCLRLDEGRQSQFGKVKLSDEEYYRNMSSLPAIGIPELRFLTVPIQRAGETIAIAELVVNNWGNEKESYLSMVQVAAKQLSVQLERSQAQSDLENNYNELKKAHDDLKRTKDQLVHSEKMASIGQLAAGIAHEINNPIGFVMSNVETLNDYLKVLHSLLVSQDQYFELMDSNKENDARTVREQIDNTKNQENLNFILGDLDEVIRDSMSGLLRVKDIVGGLKNFSRVGENKFAEGVLDEMVEESTKLVWNEIKYKCELEKTLGAPMPINFNASQLSQVVINLLVNASQAIEEQGVISISTKQTDSETTIIVSDTGKGMSEDQMRRIFDPFYTTKPVNVGTGLGLSITHGIIENHNGKIFVSSKLNEGTSFTIVLPNQR